MSVNLTTMTSRRNGSQGLAHLATIITIPITLLIGILERNWWGAALAFVILGGTSILLYRHAR